MRYYEVYIIRGLCRVGFATSEGNLTLGRDNFGFGFGATGKKVWKNKFKDYGESFDEGDVIGCYLDLDEEGSISFSKNGKTQISFFLFFTLFYFLF